MGEVTVLRREDDPEALVILASGVPSSPVKRPTFRVRNSRTKAYVTPTGFQPDVYEFFWDVTREEDALKFRGPLGAFSWLKADDPLALEIPAVGYSAKISFRLEYETTVEPRASPKLPESAPAGAEERPLPDFAEASILSGGSFRKRGSWSVVVAILATIAAALAGWEFIHASNERNALASLNHNYETEKPALEAERDTAKQVAINATSKKEELIRSVAASEQQRDTARKDADAARTELKNERVRLAGALAVAEQQRDRALKDTGDTLAELRREKEAHASTRERLASLQKQIDTERIARASAPLKPDELVSLRAELNEEQNAHAITRNRLARVERQLDEERASTNSSVQQPASPLPSPAPAQQGGAQSSLPAQTAAPSVPPVQPLDDVRAAPQASITDCDTLAANPNDPRRVSRDVGVKFPDLRQNAGPAIEACDRALVASPSEQRFIYQRARALFAKGDKVAAWPLFDQLVKAGYPAAFDNAAQYYTNQSKWGEAENLYRRGVSLQDPDAMVSLADRIREGKIAARTFGEDNILYERAASLGHKGAQIDVDQRRAAGALINGVGGAILRNLQTR